MTKDRIEQILNTVADAGRDVALAKCALGTASYYAQAEYALMQAEGNLTCMIEEALVEFGDAFPLLEEP